MKEFTSKKELLEYIGQAIEVESNVLSQQNLIKEYDENSEQRKPTLTQQAIPQQKQGKMQEDHSGGKTTGWFLISTAILILLITLYYSGGDYYYEDGAIGWIAFFILLCGVPGVLILRGIRKEEDKEGEEAVDRYRQYRALVESVQESNKQMEQQYYCDMRVWQAANDEAHSYFAKPLAETQEVLKNLYSADVIYPKYRNLPALTSIYEYLITGRCEELTGPHGAYNLYEDEVRKDMIISQMNQVIQNLEQIKANQYKLYEEVCRIRENTQAAVNELRAIHGYAAELTGLASLTAYYAGIAASNTNAMIYYHRLYL